MVSIIQPRKALLETTRRPDDVPACPVCAGSLAEIRGQARCTQCHTLCESACDGEAWWFLGAASWPGAWDVGSGT
jgi:hypothetical protein